MDMDVQNSHRDWFRGFVVGLIIGSFSALVLMYLGITLWVMSVERL